MSWCKQNTENLKSIDKLPFLEKKSVFQQRWLAKKYLKAYHFPLLTEKQFLARHFKLNLAMGVYSRREKSQLPPIQAVMFGELERRVDVVVFRSHFASSILNARNLVVEGHVKVNGETVFFT